MAARASSLQLITRLRSMVGDPASDTETFTDDELQDLLDERRTDVDLALLRADAALSGFPTVFRAPVRWWEADHVLADASGTVLTPVEAGTDPLAGVWTFATSQSGRVYITGRYYDLYGSAAAVLQTWAGRMARDFDFGTDGQSFSRSQKTDGLLKVAAEYARKAISPGMRLSWGVEW